MQNYLLSQPVYRYFKNFVNSDNIDYVNAKSCLKQDKVTFTYKKLVNIYIV